MFKTLKTHSLKITLIIIIIIIINNTQLPFSYENIIIWLNTRRRFLQAEVLRKGSEKFICLTHPKRRRLEHTHSRGADTVSPTLYSPFLDDSFSFFFYLKFKKYDIKVWFLWTTQYFRAIFRMNTKIQELLEFWSTMIKNSIFPQVLYLSFFLFPNFFFFLYGFNFSSFFCVHDDSRD